MFGQILLTGVMVWCHNLSGLFHYISERLFKHRFESCFKSLINNIFTQIAYTSLEVN